MAVRNTCVVEEAKDAGHAPLQLGGKGVGVKNFRKVFAGGSEIFILVCGWGGGSEIFILVCGWAGGSEIFIWCGGGVILLRGGDNFVGGVT